MNLGQILETHLGMAAHKLGYHAETPAMAGANEQDIKDLVVKDELSDIEFRKVLDSIGLQLHHNTEVNLVLKEFQNISIPLVIESMQ